MNFILFILAIVFFILYIEEGKKNKKLRHFIDKYFPHNRVTSEAYKLDVDFNKPKSTKQRFSTHSVTQDDILHYQSKKIDKQYLYPRKDLEDKSNYFYGKKVVISGDFENFDDRNEMAGLLWEVGADVDTAIGKYTDILIVGNDPGYSKMEKLDGSDIEIIDETKFLELIN